MNEREELLQKFAAAEPMISELGQTEVAAMTALQESEKALKMSKGFWLLLYFLAGFYGFGIPLGMIAELLDSAFLLLVMVVGMIGGGIFAVKYLRSMQKKKADEAQQRCDTAKQRHLQLRSSAELSFIPPDYRYSFCIQKIRSYLANSRAMTMQEAVNLYENEAHQERMEQAASIGAMYRA